MPRRVRRRRHLPTGGYREHRLAIWGVTGCVAVAAGVALTAGLAAASPQLGDIPGTTDRRPALAGLPTLHPTTAALTSAQKPNAGTNQRPTAAATYSPTPATLPASASPRASLRPRARASYPAHP
ncbi:hypothetical protein KDL01_25400 [Actinospica durhamensis]|uniref:Uncharacterized protein n=1 Tax=Actinospica durhamensis TaxID=1508375 RepID=A0A941ESS3_9ACTN|nr:hypothetical protein [Actinospica durhamensis]MBR7836641.1 hypothetical protein [Actinospica durhamensis]